MQSPLNPNFIVAEDAYESERGVFDDPVLSNDEEIERYNTDRRPE